MSEQNREKEERLFRALSGVEGELLHRSEQNEGVEKRKANGKIPQISAILCVPHCGSLSLLRGHGGCVCDSTQQLQNGRQYKQ